MIILRLICFDFNLKTDIAELRIWLESQTLNSYAIEEYRNSTSLDANTDVFGMSSSHAKIGLWHRFKMGI